MSIKAKLFGLFFVVSFLVIGTYAATGINVVALVIASLPK